MKIKVAAFTVSKKSSNTRCHQKVLNPIYFFEIHGIKTFVNGSFGLTEGHRECEMQAVMLGWLCKALLREEGATHLQNGET